VIGSLLVQDDRLKGDGPKAEGIVTPPESKMSNVAIDPHEFAIRTRRHHQKTFSRHE
jgi:hypothetical protein